MEASVSGGTAEYCIRSIQLPHWNDLLILMSVCSERISSVPFSIPISILAIFWRYTKRSCGGFVTLCHTPPWSLPTVPDQKIVIVLPPKAVKLLRVIKKIHLVFGRSETKIELIQGIPLMTASRTSTSRCPWRDSRSLWRTARRDLALQPGSLDYIPPPACSSFVLTGSHSK